ncbi:MAG: hypothetical protein D8H97_42445 [Neisseria sp.]|jgi:hypothetical protein|nr:MAG: hypothetical protein D8H97_42445 [Neisseria sp.]
MHLHVPVILHRHGLFPCLRIRVCSIADFQAAFGLLLHVGFFETRLFAVSLFSDGLKQVLTAVYPSSQKNRA